MTIYRIYSELMSIYRMYSELMTIYLYLGKVEVGSECEYSGLTAGLVGRRRGGGPR